jgi:hypothetical protein
MRVRYFPPGCIERLLEVHLRGNLDALFVLPTTGYTCVPPPYSSSATNKGSDERPLAAALLFINSCPWS